MDTPMRLHIRITLMKRFAFVIEQLQAQCSETSFSISQRLV